MREIKFRGLTINGEMVVGSLTILKVLYRGIEPGYYISNSGGAPLAYLVRPETVGEYTGLEDLHGKEIYEGDVLQFADKLEWYRSELCGVAPKTLIDKILTNHIKYPYYKAVVEFKDGTFWDSPVAELCKYWEVIGNIYENPELQGVTK